MLTVVDETAEEALDSPDIRLLQSSEFAFGDVLATAEAFWLIWLS
jgi:hypothetical protein